MEVVTTDAPRLRARARRRRACAPGARPSGSCPTMGYLHDGHLSLMARPRAECDVVAVTIFVNPLQFGAGEDLAPTPATSTGDLGLVARRPASTSCSRPSVDEMYPRADRSPRCSVAELAATDGRGVAARPTSPGWPPSWPSCSTSPGRAGPTSARRTSSSSRSSGAWPPTCRSPVEVVGCPIVREPDGLAMSSRNVYLTPDERAAAPVLHRALQAGAAADRGGRARPGGRASRCMADDRRPPSRSPSSTTPRSSTPPRSTPPDARSGGEVRLLVAARFGRAPPAR